MSTIHFFLPSRSFSLVLSLPPQKWWVHHFSPAVPAQTSCSPAPRMVSAMLPACNSIQIIRSISSLHKLPSPEARALRRLTLENISRAVASERESLPVINCPACELNTFAHCYWWLNRGPEHRAGISWIKLSCGPAGGWEGKAVY